MLVSSALSRVAKTRVARKKDSARRRDSKSRVHFKGIMNLEIQRDFKVYLNGTKIPYCGLRNACSTHTEDLDWGLLGEPYSLSCHGKVSTNACR